VIGSGWHLPDTGGLPMLELYTTEQAINSAVKAFHNNGQALQAEAHKIALSVLHHVGTHADIRVLRRFLDAMPDIARTNSLRKWFETFGPVTFEGNVAHYAKGKATRLGDAMSKPFWKFKANEGDEYQPLDVAKAIEALIKKIEMDGTKTERDHSATILALKYVPVAKEVRTSPAFKSETLLITHQPTLN
jgi:hypothetical protein